MTNEKLSEMAFNAINRLNEAGGSAFITCESCGPESRFQVVAKFRNLNGAQEYHRALIECGEAAREIQGTQNANGQQ